jgi:hypothetical protein
MGIRLFGNILYISCGKLNTKQLYFGLYFRNSKNSWLFITIATITSYDNYTFRDANGCSILFSLKIFGKYVFFGKKLMFTYGQSEEN